MENIYIALDFPTWKKADQFIKKNNFVGKPVKVGMELFYREGPDLIKRLKDNNHPIFLDLKLHDIPITVYKAMKNLGKLDVEMVNVHATGGSEMMKRAKEGLLEGSPSGKEPILLAVTVLTSTSPDLLVAEHLVQQSLENYVAHLATLAKENHCDGVVCSVHEVAAIKEACGSSFLTVTPGIRLPGSAQHDQTRIATPEKAKKLGADTLVVGRTVTMAENPEKAYQQILKEWEHGS